MEKYRLIQESKADEHDLAHGANAASSMLEFPEVRITQQGKPRNYISYAMNLFSDGSPTIVLKAMGKAINKAVTIAEILKRKMFLHQINSLSSVEMIDVYEPVEEGLDLVTNRRFVSCMKIILSLERLDSSHSGYQTPLAREEMHPGDYHPTVGSSKTSATPMISSNG
ncbi:hypothetical protein PHATRDRAFT_54956 [Phaeodactylum tricornutum CCAP 1055/1]|jgi:ribonuclease P/MRP protein subunit RPP25|uniref:DNA/RNA-binding protein Alba-like domain-containing protein n=3 Tax=Phaeodactylum tricornutum TaxID=2850 RepID=B7G8J5_PHATC|nr:hypothetical protein PHATRDRAFT_54956 [Phaeodactylum tricornutum CCAP 1055/1]EEC45182.1 hypothetical protein PHATRDRAFT_54956 [Phaeodactylum tricornutum CCAP 1055/1]|mmetsp:Transcript_77755/g.207717  ORF Transcript_77755/g.207717 Transcript_77755/m.207717 type:complete len:168 (+) Transcript_77755:157-660(+)|eukprot:XP_002183482.1 hypothetical protein PHATRDRAFT_54956 [Phaeodactylum tricornutum CCAP 1055/1]